MKYSQAVNMAIKALETRRHYIAIDANHADIYSADYPYAISCSRERKKINEAINLLRGNPRMEIKPEELHGKDGV